MLDVKILHLFNEKFRTKLFVVDLEMSMYGYSEKSAADWEMLRDACEAIEEIAKQKGIL